MKKGAICILICILAISCLKDEYPTKDIVGKWRLTSIYDISKDKMYDYIGRYYEFNADGTGRIVRLHDDSGSAYITEISYWNVYSDQYLIIRTSTSSNVASEFMFKELNKNEMILQECYGSDGQYVKEYTFRRAKR